MSGELVYLGTCDVENAFDERSGWEVDRIGGAPAWLGQQLQVRCSECQGDVLFVGQLNCPLDAQHFRVLYLFVCPLPTCVLKCSNWCVIRCQKEVEKVSQVENKSKVKSVFDDFSFDNLDWQMEAETNVVDIDCNHGRNKKVCDLGDGKQIIDKMSELTMDVEMESAREPLLGAESAECSNFFKTKADFRPFYIDVYMEQDQLDDLTHEYEILKKYLKKENINLSDIENPNKVVPVSSAGTSIEPYEKRASGAIPPCQKKFFKRVKKCPQQVLRYAYNDQPLCYNAPISASASQACSCGADRVFELQVMPAIREYLIPTSASCMLLEISESTCVFVFTCSRNCDGAANQEQVIVQRDVETRRST